MRRRPALRPAAADVDPAQRKEDPPHPCLLRFTDVSLLLSRMYVQISEPVDARKQENDD